MNILLTTKNRKCDFTEWGIIAVSPSNLDSLIMTARLLSFLPAGGVPPYLSSKRDYLSSNRKSNNEQTGQIYCFSPRILLQQPFSIPSSPSWVFTSGDWLGLAFFGKDMNGYGQKPRDDRRASLLPHRLSVEFKCPSILSDRFSRTLGCCHRLQSLLCSHIYPSFPTNNRL
jgi:hypothetical protein